LKTSLALKTPSAILSVIWYISNANEIPLENSNELKTQQPSLSSYFFFSLIYIYIKQNQLVNPLPLHISSHLTSWCQPISVGNFSWGQVKMEHNQVKGWVRRLSTHSLSSWLLQIEKKQLTKRPIKSNSSKKAASNTTFYQININFNSWFPFSHHSLKYYQC